LVDRLGFPFSLAAAFLFLRKHLLEPVIGLFGSDNLSEANYRLHWRNIKIRHIRDPVCNRFTARHLCRFKDKIVGVF